jgi:hypothetical protein
VSASFALPEWQSSAASSMVDVLTEDKWTEIEDVVALSGDRTPGWLQRLGIPQGWQLVALPDNPEVRLARLAVYGERGDGGWEAAETISVFGYTGWPMFSEVLDKAAATLRALGTRDIVTKLLPIPSRQWTAAVRSSGIALIGGRPVWALQSNPVWVQQSSFVAGSDQPHAGRLIVHSVFVDGECRPRLGSEIVRLSDAVYQEFIAALGAEHRTG